MAKSSKIPVIAETIRRMLDRRVKGEALDPWLEFPQYKCMFTFGPNKIGLCVGALYVLWEQDERFVRTCAYCNSKTYAWGFGALLTVGGIHYACIGCNRDSYYPVWGFSEMSKLIRSSPLMDTEFRPLSAWFGSPQGSDGTHLLKELGIKGKGEKF